MKFICFLYTGEIYEGYLASSDFIVTTPYANMSTWSFSTINPNDVFLSEKAQTWHDVYKKIITQIPKEELIKALLREHAVIIRARKLGLLNLS